MAENNLSRALNNLATSSTNRPDTARLRDIFTEVEAALSAGVTHVSILEVLHSNGFALTLKSFQSSLYRLRKEREKGSRKEVTSTGAATVQVRRATPTVTPAAGPSQTLPKRGRLELAPNPTKKWEWDPLERPVIEFVDDDDPPKDEKTK
jgi:hypothetical protein